MRPAAVIPVDLFGQPADYRAILPVARAHGLRVLADTAQSYGATDWHEITSLYSKLYKLLPSPVIALNMAIALSFAEGVKAGLSALTDLDEQGVLERYQPFHAARADLFRRAGREQDAANAYRQALMLTRNAAEQRFLETRLQEVLEQPLTTR